MAYIPETDSYRQFLTELGLTAEEFQERVALEALSLTPEGLRAFQGAVPEDLGDADRLTPAQATVLHAMMARVAVKALQAKRSQLTSESEGAAGQPTRTCPHCHRSYTGHPALSRTDNKTDICSACGTSEALEAFLRFLTAN
jgi:hypothetical protein